MAKKIDARYKGRDNIFTAESRKREFENLQKQHEIAREGLPENDKGHFKNGGYKEHFYDGGELPRTDYRLREWDGTAANWGKGALDPNRIKTDITPVLQNVTLSQVQANPDIVRMGYQPSGQTMQQAQTVIPNINPIKMSSNIGAASRDNGGNGVSSGINWNKLGEAGSVMLPNILGSAANAYLASKIHYDRVSPTYQDTNLIDPNRALQQVGSTYSGANAALQSNTQGGQYLTNRLASAASEASKRAEIAQQYANANAGILNTASAANAQSQMQANMTNAQIQQQELGDRLSGYASSIQSLQQGSSDYLKAWQEQRRTEQLMPFLGGPNFKAYLDAGYNPASLMEATLYDKTYRNKNEFKR